MQELFKKPTLAEDLSANARRYAQEQFNIGRFIKDWDAAFALVVGSP